MYRARICQKNIIERAISYCGIGNRSKERDEKNFVRLLETKAS